MENWLGIYDHQIGRSHILELIIKKKKKIHTPILLYLPLHSYSFYSLDLLSNYYGLFFFLQDPIVEKIRTIAQKVYGADDIELSPEAQAKIDYYSQQVRRAVHCHLTLQMH